MRSMMEKENIQRNHFEEVYRLAAKIRLEQKKKYQASKILTKAKIEKRVNRKIGYFS